MECWKFGKEIGIYQDDREIDGRMERNVYYNLTHEFVSGVDLLAHTILQKPNIQSDLFFRKIKKLKKKSIQKVSVWKNSDSNHFRKFLKTCAIKEVLKLNLILPKNQQKIYSCFHKCTTQILPKVTTLLTLQCCQISKNQLRKIIQVGRHIKVMRYVRCKIDSSDIELAKSLNYSIESISFNFQKFPIDQPTEEIQESMLSLIEAASLTNLKCSLSTFFVNIPRVMSCVQLQGKNLNFKSLGAPSS
ncbi:unnamed protein product [Moneuplotes crassus]|uniref:Uncharacterized protein n=1 Tax=Euplotes crassus TaxID=5936 RepID=A0AAD2D4G4_EUPCR|nr:unnamed protein product [Moneuplotes crassus]